MKGILMPFLSLHSAMSPSAEIKSHRFKAFSDNVTLRVFSPDVLQKSLNNAFHPHIEFVGGSGKAGFLTGFH